MLSSEENHIINQVISPDYERTIAHLENLMVVVCDFKNGPMKSPDLPHSHPHEQITYVAEGELIFFKAEMKVILKKGDMITIMPGTPHCIQTLSNTVKLIDTFFPVREDFLK